MSDAKLEEKLLVWRSLLYVPANNQRFIDKAHTRGADAIILDLEDSVPASATVASNNSARRPATTTEYPSFRRASAVRFPIPVPAPVIIATFTDDPIDCIFSSRSSFSKFTQ